MTKRFLTALIGVIAVAIGLTTAVTAPANAAGGVWCDPGSGRCYVTLASPPTDPAYSPDSNGWTAGAPECFVEVTRELAEDWGLSTDELKVIPISATAARWFMSISCGDGQSYWSNNRQCYISMAPQPWPPRGGYSDEAGYYQCIKPAQFGPGVWSYFWSETIPPGLQVYTPGMAALKLIETFQLRGIDIGMAPEVNPDWGHRRSYVGIPVWLWVENPQPLTWGPYSETATLGGQTITATARVSSAVWNMGDGRTFACGAGTAYNEGYGLADSPTCGHRYLQTSENQPGDRYRVSATTYWVIEWTSLAGVGGTVNLSTTSDTIELEVNELQSVNVKTNGG
ncbi:hypothetical protein [Microbacterium paludicola]|nr:hypothetical protein [Microbacterium paludicola]